MYPYFQIFKPTILIFLAKLQSYVCMGMLVNENDMDLWEVVAWFGFVAMGV
jgi:hypothetical protein